MINVVIADDHVMFRQGLARMLSQAEDICVVGDAGDGETALKLIAEKNPAVAILDISMPPTDGIEVLQRLRRIGLQARVVFLTMHKDPVLAKNALNAGASGYVLKDDVFENLIHAVRTIVAGGRFISIAVMEAFMEAFPGGGKEQTGLTTREREVLRLISSGLTNKEIAAELAISIKTVETHRTRIMEKLDLHTVAELVRYAIRMGIAGNQ